MNASEFIHPRSSHETSRTPKNPGSSQQAARPEVQRERSIRLDSHRTIARERGEVHHPPVHDQPLLDSVIGQGVKIVGDADLAFLQPAITSR
jgi:hypothetical protein